MIKKGKETVILRQVFEGGGLQPRHVAEVFVPVPDAQLTVKNGSLEEIEFSSQRQASYNHSAVGSGR